jgi:hypothetical protein
MGLFSFRKRVCCQKATSPFSYSTFRFTAFAKGGRVPKRNISFKYARWS